MQDPMDMDGERIEELRRWNWTMRVIGGGIVVMLFLIWTAINRGNPPRGNNNARGTASSQSGQSRSGGTRPGSARSGSAGGGTIVAGNDADHPCHLRLEGYREALRTAEDRVNSLADLGISEPPRCPENDEGYLFARETQSVACRTIGHENY